MTKSNTKYKKSIFLFTRDFRIHDNTSLNECSKVSETVMPVFIFNPQQIDNVNSYKSDFIVKFMIESLHELDKELRKKKSKLYYFYGDPVDVIHNIIKKDDEIDAVFMNIDYTPFAKKRYDKIKKMLNNNNKHIESYHDYLLTDDKIKKPDGSVYVKYTPFYNTAHRMKVREVDNHNINNLISSRYVVSGEVKNIDKYCEDIDIKYGGGRTHAMDILKNIGDFDDYSKTRDSPSIETTHLSCYLKFNLVSIREVYYIFKKKLKPSNLLFKQLYWRDFYVIIMDNYPDNMGGNMRDNLKITWKNDKVKIKKWKEGKTGFPIVDAGMRQLNETGWMHNRVRMIVADFLIKILHVDWRIGEKYFAQKLIDYEPSVNNGSWQWQAGTGVDSQPYFRIFNPWRQQINHDYDCVYIKKWVEELRNIDNNVIHNWGTECVNHDVYVKPIVDYEKESKMVLKLYKKYVK